MQAGGVSRHARAREAKSRLKRDLTAVSRHARAREDLNRDNLSRFRVSRHARAREAKSRLKRDLTAVSRHARAREVPPAWGGVNLRPPA